MGEVDLPVGQLLDGELHRLGYVEELDVGEHLLALGVQPVDHVEILASHEELEAELVKMDGVAEALDPPLALVERGDVEGEDQAVARRDGLRGEVGRRGHRTQMPATRPRGQDRTPRAGN